MKRIALFLFASIANAQTWHASMAVLSAAQVADVVSSVNGRECNKLLSDRNGRFNVPRAIALKTISTAVVYVIERRTMTPKRRKLYIAVNIGLSVGLTAIAVRNVRTK